MHVSWNDVIIIRVEKEEVCILETCFMFITLFDEI